MTDSVTPQSRMSAWMFGMLFPGKPVAGFSNPRPRQVPQKIAIGTEHLKPAPLGGNPPRYLFRVEQERVFRQGVFLEILFCPGSQILSYSRPGRLGRFSQSRLHIPELPPFFCRRRSVDMLTSQ